VGSSSHRKVRKYGYLAEGRSFSPKTARFSYLMSLTNGEDIEQAGNDAMKGILEFAGGLIGDE